MESSLFGREVVAAGRYGSFRVKRIACTVRQYRIASPFVNRIIFLFQLVSKRYTKGSIIVTSNKSYLEWGGVFGDEVAAAAILDRLLHYSTTVNIRGESYRLKDRKRADVRRALDQADRLTSGWGV
jgi:hypothetical protein